MHKNEFPKDKHYKKKILCISHCVKKLYIYICSTRNYAEKAVLQRFNAKIRILK